MYAYISYLQFCLEYASLRIVTPDMSGINTVTAKLYKVSDSSHGAGEHVNGSVGP